MIIYGSHSHFEFGYRLTRTGMSIYLGWVTVIILWEKPQQ